jgi:hypothetical protein
MYTRNLLTTTVVILHTFLAPFSFALEELPLDLTIQPDEGILTEPLEEPLISPSVVPLETEITTPLTEDEERVVDPKKTMHWRRDVLEDEEKDLRVFWDKTAPGLWVDCGTGA